MNKCQGCGTLLQTYNSDLEGYTKSSNSILCERCFRIKHYNDYKVVIKDNQDYINILNDINKTNDLVVLVVDLFSIPKKLADIRLLLSNPMLLVLTKRDLLPKSLYEDKLINYFTKFGLNVLDTILVSSKNNYHFDHLLDKIREYQTSNRVYVVGYTNAGKSSMMNKLLYNYTNSDIEITTSLLPSTTLNTIEVKIDNNLTLIDTPGLLEEHNINNYISVESLKKVTPKSTIKPITYQVKVPQIFIIDKFVRIDCQNNNNLTFFISNKLGIERFYKDRKDLVDLEKHVLKINDNQDIVITGLGFIKVMHKDVITLYTISGVDVYVRDSLI